MTIGIAELSHNQFDSMTFVENRKKDVINPSAMKKLGQDPSTSEFRTFEEIYRTSYSHGLEAIYNVENVDLKTVRRITSHTTIEPAKKRSSLDQSATQSQIQLEFDFGDAFKGCMDSFMLEEPINVLGLGPHVEKCLHEQGLPTLKALSKADLNKLVYVKGVGQGHIDEVHQKLRSYLEGHLLYDCQTIDLTSWLRSLLGVLSKKKMYVAMEPFQLADYFSLSPMESVEVRRLTFEKRLEWRNEILPEMLKKKERLLKDLKKVVDIYIKPWMDRRHGFATRNEILERLQRVSLQQTLVPMVMDFFSTVYFSGSFALGDYLDQFNEDLFFVDKFAKKAYQNIIDKTLTYFYNDDLHYSLAELVTLVFREFASDWEHYPFEFIEKTLRSSPLFRVRKEDCGRLIIRV